MVFLVAFFLVIKFTPIKYIIDATSKSEIRRQVLQEITEDIRQEIYDKQSELIKKEFDSPAGKQSSSSSFEVPKASIETNDEPFDIDSIIDQEVDEISDKGNK